MKLHRIAQHALTCLVVASATVVASAQAAPTISLNSAVFVERTQSNVRSLEPASRLTHGDRVVTIVTWYRMGGAGGFVVTNPLPRSIAYQESSRDDEEVSVDGGKTWGRLGSLRVGSRSATPEDVTHVRWRISAIRASQGRGDIAYSGIVR